MLNINSNYGAAFAAKAAKSTNSALNTSFERLSSGSRINFAKDDAAGQVSPTAFVSRASEFKWHRETHQMPKP